MIGLPGAGTRYQNVHTGPPESERQAGGCGYVTQERAYYGGDAVGMTRFKQKGER